MKFELRELHPDDGCTALSLGDPGFKPLKSFLRKEAKKLHQSNLARTFVVTEEEQTKVLAYVTTLCTQISVEQFVVHQQINAFKYKDYPAIKLARLAVDSSLKGQGLGSRLVDFVMGLAMTHVMPYTGCRFLIVDAKHQSVGFYERKGFRHIGQIQAAEDHYSTMFVDLHRMTTNA